MNQVRSFYLTSFLKNQTYFAPVFVLLLQFYHLTFQEIFWVFTIGSIISFVIEIPSGIIADLYGKRSSLVVAKFLIFISYILFGFANNFWFFVFAQVVFEFGNAFRSGTETSYVFEYLSSTKNTPSYPEVKAKQKIYARIGESIATALGGIIASFFGFSWVFFIAAIPAFVNFVVCLFWKRIKENNEKVNNKEIKLFIKDAFRFILKKKSIWSLGLNISIFGGAIVALDKFIQPYMVDAGIPVYLIGFIYAAMLLIAVFSIKYSLSLGKKYGIIKVVNLISLISVIPVLLLSFISVSYVGVVLFVVVLIIYNMRAPLLADEFQKQIVSKSRATMTSILELSKSGAKIIILPIIGYFADTISMFFAILIIGTLLLLTTILFRLSNNKHSSNS